jgi:hypothetical protein
MRALFSVLGLLLVVVVIGMLAKKQLSSVAAPPLPVAPGVTVAPGGPPATPQQTVQQFQQAVQSQMQQARPMPEETK